MSGVIDADRLVSACGDESFEAGITIRSDLEPLGGNGDLVKPAGYEGGRFQTGRRWVGSGDERTVVDVLVIDNEPSQANRIEAALQSSRDLLGLPDIVLDLSSVGSLPPHLPTEISIFQFPHRNADAYLRDAELDGLAFPKTDIGQAIFSATASNADALFTWCPQSLLFGFWQSHLGKKRSQAKKARSWTSEIVGIAPAAVDIRRLGLKGDPLNLNISDLVEFDENDLLSDWKIAAKGKKLADLGHGQVPIGGDGAAPAGVSFREIVQQATVSFASLRTIRATRGSAEGRALLVALGLVGHLLAFGRSFHLRSGAELRMRSTTWNWLGESGVEETEFLKVESALALLSNCAARAEAAGLDVGSQWPGHRLVLAPAGRLVEAIKKSWPEA